MKRTTNCRLSFRVFEFGIFGALLAFDLLWGRTLFQEPAALESSLGHIGTEEEMQYGHTEVDERVEEALYE